MTLTKKVFNEIEKIYQSSKHDNWDGENAEAISEEKLESAKTFFNKLMESGISSKALKSIEISPENLGNFCFDWFVDHDLQMSISVFSKEIVFVCKFPTDAERSGKQSIDTNIDDIVELINKLYKPKYLNTA